MNFIHKHFSLLALGLIPLGILVILLIVFLNRDNLPSGVVARVDKTNITKKEFDTYLPVIRSQRLYATYTNGIPGSTPVNISKEAQKQVKDGTMFFLLQREFFKQALDKLGVTPTEAEIKNFLKTTKKSNLGGGNTLNKYLTISGVTRTAYNNFLLLQFYAARLTDSSFSYQMPEPTDAEALKFYKKNQKSLVGPARSVQVIVTRDLGDALVAKKAWEADPNNHYVVAKKYSLMPLLPPPRRLPGVKASSSPAALSNAVVVSQTKNPDAVVQAIFKTKNKQISGPIKNKSGYYVVYRLVSVSRIPTGANLIKKAKMALAQEEQVQALTDFQKNFNEEWRKKTVCADDYIVNLCGNGPGLPKQPSSGVTPKTTTTNTTTTPTTPPGSNNTITSPNANPLQGVFGSQPVSP